MGKSFENIEKNFENILDMVVLEKEKFLFPIKAIITIRETSEMCKHTNLYVKTIDRRAKLEPKFREHSASDMYMHLLDRVVSAPTTIHMCSSIIILLPMLDNKLADDFDEIKIKQFKFTTKTLKALQNSGIETIEDLKRCSMDGLMKLRGVGNKAINEIEEFNKAYGVTLAEESLDAEEMSEM